MEPSSKIEDNNCKTKMTNHPLKKNNLISFIKAKLPFISSEKIRNRIISLIITLESSKINYGELRQLIIEGIPDDIPSLRSLIWKILLDQLSLNVNEWDNLLNVSRKKYDNYKLTFFNIASINKMAKNSDHPLSIVNESKWNQYFQDANLREAIDKDVKRTQTHMSFFFMPCKSSFGSSNVSSDQIIKSAELAHDYTITNHKKNSMPKEFETNADVMKRILFIYGKLYPEISYVQGMNELLAPIMYCFSNDQNIECLPYSEADAFTCFENLMKKVSNVFIKSKDDHESGINTRMKTLNKLIRLFNIQLHAKLEKENIDIQYYAFRWLTLFFTQDFEMPEVLRLWDVLLSEEDLFEFVYMISIGIINIQKEEILNGDFVSIMEIINNFEQLNAEILINEAFKIRKILSNLV